jgi:glycerol kinase
VYIDAPEMTKPESLHVDGGATRNNLFLQIQANILGLPIERHHVAEATALGAALYAGETLGFWTSPDVEDLHRVDRIFTPLWSDD